MASVGTDGNGGSEGPFLPPHCHGPEASFIHSHIYPEGIGRCCAGPWGSAGGKGSV